MPPATPDPVPSPAPQEAAGVGATPSELSGRWGQQHSAPFPVGLAGLGARGQEPTAPGPTVAELQAHRDYERQRANEAIAQLYDARRELAALRATLGMAP